MAWTVPITWLAGQYPTAALLNAQLRDNMLATAAGKATTAGRLFFTSGDHAISERPWEVGTMDGTGTTTGSTSYVDLSDGAGASVTLTTGTQACVFWGAQMATNTATTSCRVSFAISGATTTAASDNYPIVHEAGTTLNLNMGMSAQTIVPVNAGSNTFTMKYKMSSAAATGTFLRRRISVVSL